MTLFPIWKIIQRGFLLCRMDRLREIIYYLRECLLLQFCVGRDGFFCVVFAFGFVVVIKGDNAIIEALDYAVVLGL